MILHIASDEKFIDIGFRVFEEVKPNGNKLIVVTSKNEVKFVKKSPFEQRTPKEVGTKEFSLFIEDFEGVVLHSLSYLNIKFPPHIKVVWIGFGFDYYNLIYKNTDALLLPETLHLKQTLTSNNGWKQKLKQFPLACKINDFIKGKIPLLEFINRIDFFAPVLNSEYDLVAKAIPNFIPNFIDWNYGTLEDDWLYGFENKTITGNNILVGNSATYENNHLEVFQLLTALSVKDKNIICSLSYGNEKYKNAIDNYGKNKFGQQFNSLSDFMPIKEYIELLSSCSVVIMNHIRQQALGNIIIMLYFGATVFLRKENPIYTLLNSNGAKVYSIEDLEKNQTMINKKITKEELSINRDVLRKHWSRDVIKENTKILIDKITSN